jgi:hypothetical protein
MRVERRQHHALDAVTLGPFGGPIGEHGAQAAAAVVGIDIHVTEPRERRAVGHDARHRDLLPVRGEEAY